MTARALVVGASGQVGTQMLRLLGATRGQGYALPSSRETGGRSGWLEMDLSRITGASVGTLLLPFSLDAMFCIGGMTDVERCETEPEQADGANARGPAILAGYARQIGVPFTYFSTEYVFDGDPERPGPYPETAPTHALSVYGTSKLAGERAVLDAHPDALIVRTTVVYGEDDQKKNYVYSLLRNLATGRRMRVPADQVSTPTYNRDLVRANLRLVEAGAKGIWNLCGPECLSRIEFARQVAAFFDLDAALLEPVPTAKLAQKAARPLQAGLATQKLRREFPDVGMRTVNEALRDCEEELRGFLRSVQAPELRVATR